MIRAHRLIIASLLTLTCFACVLAQSLPGPTAKPPLKTDSVLLTVGGEIEHPLKLTASDLAKLPHKSVRAKGHDEKEAVYDGVELVEILKLAGLKFGEQLRGKSLALFLQVDANDGYRAVFALPELDPAFIDRLVLLGDRKDGKPLDSKEGPLMIVTPDEKRHARWVRQVVSLTIRRAN